jgi:hypothetical protein
VGNFKGFAELRVPYDLVIKLKYDLERIRESPQDQYAAFDFFVTAEHLIDWVYPDDKAARTSLRSSTSILRITSHLANGVKHFEAKSTHHKSVAEVEKSRYVEPGYIEEGYFEDPLIVHLTTNEEMSFGKGSIKVIALAEQVYEYWKANAPRPNP